MLKLKAYGFVRLQQLGVENIPPAPETTTESPPTVDTTTEENIIVSNRRIIKRKRKRLYQPPALPTTSNKYYHPSKWARLIIPGILSTAAAAIGAYAAVHKNPVDHRTDWLDDYWSTT